MWWDVGPRVGLAQLTTTTVCPNPGSYFTTPHHNTLYTSRDRTTHHTAPRVQFSEWVDLETGKGVKEAQGEVHIEIALAALEVGDGGEGGDPNAAPPPLAIEGQGDEDEGEVTKFPPLAPPGIPEGDAIEEGGVLAASTGDAAPGEGD